eukprot:TRINITY_DN3718_c0_g1_i1.p1 TRINITY_DN3718_c0_g1~~TRINITY_DN3718_c0_g1_i1.p1  ORF type:complete len:273 (-),score=24.66 TRINITY_DN3718_c0_g1_i1:17-835(-)
MVSQFFASAAPTHPSLQSIPKAPMTVGSATATPVDPLADYYRTSPVWNAPAARPRKRPLEDANDAPLAKRFFSDQLARDVGVLDINGRRPWQTQNATTQHTRPVPASRSTKKRHWAEVEESSSDSDNADVVMRKRPRPAPLGVVESDDSNSDSDKDNSIVWLPPSAVRGVELHPKFAQLAKRPPSDITLLSGPPIRRARPLLKGASDSLLDLLADREDDDLLLFRPMEPHLRIQRPSLRRVYEIDDDGNIIPDSDSEPEDSRRSNDAAPMTD